MHPMPKIKSKLPTWTEMCATARASDTSWKTVRRWYLGLPIRPSTRARIVKALKAAATKSRKQGGPK